MSPPERESRPAGNGSQQVSWAARGRGLALVRTMTENGGA
jgi:hypothetical protein